MKKFWKSMILAAALAALCVAPAHALEYNIDGAEDYLFGRPTSDDTIYEWENPNVDRSKNAALIPPGFGTPTSYLPNSGEYLTPKHNFLKRAVSLLLTLVCVVGVLPLSVFAAEGLSSAPGSITQRSSDYMKIGGRSVRYRAASSTINNVGLPYVFNEQVDVPGLGPTRALCAYQKGTLGPGANGQKWNFKEEVNSASLQVLDIKKLLLQNFPYVFLFWFFDRVGEGWRLAAGADVVEKAIGMVVGLGQLITRNPLPSLHPQDLLVGLIGAVAVRAVVYFKAQNAKKYRRGVEYGSARWGNAQDIAPFIDPKFDQNILLTQTERIMVGRNKNPKYNINKNVLIIGGSGSGKTRFHIKPSASVRAE